ncbi:NAD(P)-dependent alcohol dehydrogenase [Corallococcus interemptor]|uniref:NAD(P)-dependent alcohol dehydrogenase n=1 Tax=Corallococcus interemptor TaxID=2316720 RepID=A0A3A8PN63_9BACT|nr:NAD(P)-dependent alcohol dehydrogenase [Corallococcus interemptor]RKH57559.1 NAD(P)-dependent alcohol dehydrogenase [Corallococcus interemptor]
MNALTYSRFGNLDVLRHTHSPAPRVRAHHLLIRVRAVSVNPIDGKIRRGELRLLSGARFPKATGSDFAGVVEAVGAGVEGFSVGDRVFGFPGIMREGTLAELITVAATSVARVPSALDDVGAAAVSMVGLAALQAWRDVARVAPGERVLVNGATGGVGLMLIQLARARGAHVTAVTSAAGLAVARQYGAQVAHDYRARPLSVLGERFDVIFDLSTKVPFADARGLLAPRGRHVGFEPSPALLLGSALLNPFRRQKQRVLVTRPSAKDLAELAGMFQTGELLPPPMEVFELSDAQAAFERSERGGVIGKVVIRAVPSL